METQKWKTYILEEIGSEESNYSINSGKYGDAVYETSTNGNTSNSSWYGNHSDFPRMGVPFFERGGSCDTGTTAGVFAFCYFDGDKFGNISFRPVLVAL